MKKDMFEIGRKKFYRWLAKNHSDVITPMRKYCWEKEEFFLRIENIGLYRFDPVWKFIWRLPVGTPPPYVHGHPLYDAPRSMFRQWYETECSSRRKEWEDRKEKEEELEWRRRNRIEELSRAKLKIGDEKPIFETMAFLSALQQENIS